MEHSRTDAIRPARVPRPTSRLSELGPSVGAGTICALVSLTYTLSYAALIFSGKNLEPHLPAGLHAALIATWLTALVVALRSSFPFAIAGADSNATAGLALISSSLSTELAAKGMTDARLPATVLMMLMISAIWIGLVVLLLGASRRGGLVRFIPYPVAGGFLAGTGFLLVSGGFKLLTGKGLGWHTLSAPPHVPMLAWLVAGAVAIALLTLPRLSRHYLVIPGTMAAGILVFYAGLIFAGMDVATARDQGLLFKPLAPLSTLPSAATFAHVEWQSLLAQWQNFLALTVIVVVTILLNATGLEVATRHDVDFDRELRVNGTAGLLSGLFGGTIGYLSISRSFLNFRAGARSRLAGVWTAMLCLGATYWFTTVLSYVPVPVLAGLLLYLGLSELLEWVWHSYARLPRIEYGLILMILLLIATRGLITGVAFGVLVASIFFAYSYSRISCIKNSVSGSAHFSNKERPLEHIARLKERGRATRALTLQGYLFFGTSNVIVEACRDLIAKEGLRYLLLDFRLVQGLDVSAAWSFLKLEQICSRAGVTLLFSGVSRPLQKVLEQAELLPRPGSGLFSDLDHGLEWIEEQLLAEGVTASAGPSQDPMDLGRILSEHFKPEALAILTRYCQRLDLQANVPLFRQGDPGDALYFVEAGQISVVIPVGDGQTKRLRTYGPGTVVGEMAVYSRHPRSADVVTDVPSRVGKLSAENLDRMEREHPAVAIQFHTFVVKLLSSRLALANEEILSVL